MRFTYLRGGGGKSAKGSIDRIFREADSPIWFNRIINTGASDSESPEHDTGVGRQQF